MIKGNSIRILAVVVFVFGFAAAIFIYFNADPLPGNPFGYDRLSDKKYIHELERFGGKFAVLSAELSRWLTGLWQGQQLAFTIGCISLSLAALLWFLGASRAAHHHGDQKNS